MNKDEATNQSKNSNLSPAMRMESLVFISGTPRLNKNFVPSASGGVIITDIDEVLARTLDKLRLALWTRFGVWIDHKDIKDWNLVDLVADRLGFTVNEADHLLMDGYFNNPEFVASAEPYEKWWRFLYKQVRVDTDLWYVTSRAHSLFNVTKQWLERLGLPVSGGCYEQRFTTLLLTSGLYEKEKPVEDIVKLYPENTRIVFVDDRKDTACRVAKSLPQISVLMPARPWNNKANNVTCCESESELIKLTSQFLLNSKTVG